MLHIIFDETRNTPFDKMERSSWDYTNPTFQDVHSIQKKFCSEFESMAILGRNPLRTELITRYLKELWNVEWYDDFTFLLDVNDERMRVTPTHLSYDLQLTILLLYYAELEKEVRLMQFIPYLENLGWVSENCEMTIHLDVAAVQYFSIGGGERTEEAIKKEGLFDLVWQGKHYNCSWIDFIWDELGEYFEELKVFDKKAEQHFFGVFRQSVPDFQTSHYSLVEFVQEKKPNFVEDQIVHQYPELIVEYEKDYLFESKYHKLFYLLRKGDTIYYYNQTAGKYPDLCSLIVYYCLSIEHSTEGDSFGEGKGFSVTGKIDKWKIEDLAPWADEVILLVGPETHDVTDFYKDCEVCMRYVRKDNLLQILSKEKGIPLFHEWFQKSVPLSILANKH